MGKKLAKNVYMGKNSIAKIPIFGKVDTFKEVMKNLYATAYDALNLVLLDNDYPGLIVNERILRLSPLSPILSMFRVVDEESFFMTLKGRFNVLRSLAVKIKDKQKVNYALAKINQIEALIFNILQRFHNPKDADVILKNEMFDVLDITEMNEIDRLITIAETKLIKQIAQRKLLKK